MPPETISVCRPGKFGNPFKVTEGRTAADTVLAFRSWLTADHCHANMAEEKETILNSLHELTGKDLACWCSLSQPCHADVLLDLANNSAGAVAGD